MEPHHPFIGGDLVMACVSEVSTIDLAYRGLDIKMLVPPTLGGRGETSALKVRNGLNENKKEIERWSVKC